MSQRRSSDVSHGITRRRESTDLHVITGQNGSATMTVQSGTDGGHNIDNERRGRSTMRRRGSSVVHAIESPLQDHERLEDAESLFAIDQPPEEVESSPRRTFQRRRSRSSDASHDLRGRRPSREATDLHVITEQNGSALMYIPSRDNSDIKKDGRSALVRRGSQIVDAIESPLQDRERLEDAESLFSIDQPPDETEVEEGSVLTLEEKEVQKVYHPMALAVITSLIPGSIFGLLARLGLEALTNYEGRAIFPLAWIQAIGCLVMGFGVGTKDQLGAYYGPLYTAIATGFCGSLTTFSGWQFDVFTSWANTGHARRDWFRDVIDGLAKTIFTLAISLSSVTLGLHLSRIVTRRVPRVRRASLYTRYVFRIVSVLMYVATILAYFLASPSFRHQATAALLFCFPGTLTRYILSTNLTPLLHLFPLGTFVANTSGTALFGIFHVLQRTPRLPSQNACAILQGLIDGYCGCLTTVSTFAVEVQALKTKKAWLYVILSWSVSQLLLLVILGTAWWGGNIDDSRMCTFA